jgi:hypothetical protein
MSSARQTADGWQSRWHPVPSERVRAEQPGWDVGELARIMQEHPNYTALGAIGPDLFFFLPDFRDIGGFPLSSALVQILNFVEGVYDALDPYIAKYERYLGPISEDEAEELSRLTGGLSESVGNITGELSSILITALADLATQQSDLWEKFSLGLNKGHDEKAYLWSDMLHYRETGDFAAGLFARAVELEDPALQAYACGYLSHVATDTVGHALVNQIAGGPFRVHWQRHHLVENHADSYWYGLDPEPMAPHRQGGYDQLTESALYYDIAFDERDNSPVTRPALPGGRTMRELWTRKRLLDIDSEIPDEVADLLIETMTRIFYTTAEVPHPEILEDNDGKPDADLVAEAYRLFVRYLKVATVDGISHERPDPPALFPNLDFPTPSDPAGDGPPGDDDGGGFWDDLLDFILAVVAVIAYIVEVAVYLATLPWAILADLVTYPIRLGLYYALELPLFHLLKAFRSVLVRTAYLTPMRDEIDQSLIRVGNPMRATWAQVRDDLGDVFGGFLGDQPIEETVTFRDPGYPYVHAPGEFHHPWQYPAAGTPTERCPTTGGPHPRDAGPPHLFATQPPAPDIRDALENAPDAPAADRAGCDLTPDRHLGDVVTMSRYLIWLTTRTEKNRITNWNMDSDRGYGYHCWDWNRQPGQDPVTDSNTRRTPFVPPCTWPSQSEDHEYSPDTRLQLHWAAPDGTDPGCVEPQCADCSTPPIG